MQNTAESGVPATKEALTATEAATLIGISVRGFLAIAGSDPAFPPSIRVGPGQQPRSRRWIRSEVLDWLKNYAPRDASPVRKKRTDSQES